MKVTIFNASKTTGKYPNSPYDDDTFLFETKNVQSIEDVFEHMVSNFTLNIPLVKNVKRKRRKSDLKDVFVQKLDYIMLDIDDIDKISDRSLIIKYFKDKNYRCILGESRTDYRLKGVLKVDKFTHKEAKQTLINIKEDIKNIDRSAANLASYQAPIHKHKILYNSGTSLYPKPILEEKVITKVNVPESIEKICIDEFCSLGFSFIEQTENGFRCSHISEVKTKGGFTWNKDFPFNMSHWNPARNVNIWEKVVRTEQYKQFQDKEANDKIKEKITLYDDTCSERYLHEHIKEVNHFLDYTDMLKIQSPMGTGKSKVIEQVIHQSRKRNLKVLFLTNRISLADDISNKYDNIKHYLGTEAEENNYTPGDDLVVQIDSLHKFSTKYFDVVILDEAATTLMYLLQLENHQKKIATQIFSLKNRKLVLADAFLFDDMIDIFEPKSITSITNSYRDEVEINLYKNKDNFIKSIIDCAKVQPCTVSSGSIQVLKVIKLLLDNLGIKNFTISSETPKKQKEAIFNSFNKHEPVAQVIMYSPTLTVGVSNENNTNVHFHFDSGMSMDVLSSLQMIKRTRQCKELNLFLQQRKKYNKTDINIIQQQLTDFITQDDDGDDTGISNQGKNFAKLQLLHNVLENRHMVSFLRLLQLQFNTKSSKFNTISTKQKPFFTKVSKVVKLKEKNEKLDIFKTYKSMSSEEISDIELMLFSKTKSDMFIKEFEKIKNELDLPDNLINLLIQEDIKHPGVIQSYKNILTKQGSYVIKNSRNYTLSKNAKNKLKLNDMSIIDFGFVTKGVLYRLNNVIKEAYEYQLNTKNK